MQLPLALFAVCLTTATAISTPTCPPRNFTIQFDRSRDFDLDAFIGARWYVQQQMECALEPANLFQCQWAKYKKIEETSPWGFTIKAHNHIDQIPGNASTMDLHPCVGEIDVPRGKLSVGQCFLPEALAGP